MIVYIGLIGALFIVLAWIPQTLHTIKTHERVHTGFSVFYITGSFLLTLYSFIIDDMVFVFLNGTALLLALVNWYYGLSVKKNGKKNKHTHK